MASIYKRTRSYPIPNVAEIIERKRKATPAERRATGATSIVERFAVWTDGKGRKRREPLDETGERVQVEAGNYLISYFDELGKRQEINSGTPDKDAAEQIAGQIETDVALRIRGVINAEQERIADAGRRTLAEHLADFQASLQAANRSADHIQRTTQYVQEIADAEGWLTLADIGPDAVNRYASDLTRQGKSARTVEKRLTAIKAFTKWLTVHAKLSRDPLASVKKPNPKADRRHERRMLLPDEWEWLRVTTENGPERLGIGGRERMLLYAVAIQTGLRSGECRSLTRGRLFLDTEQPFITCKARSTKNKKDARQYIQPDLAAKLQEHIRTKAPKAPVFAMPHESNVSRMFHQDLAAARLEWLKATKDPQERTRREQSDFLEAVNHEGEKADFHSLRHTTGAWLAMNGEHPKVVQTVMRHSSITLTMDTYGHLFPGQEANAVANMPSILGSGSDAPEALRATGTDSILPAYRQQSDGEIFLANGERWREAETDGGRLGDGKSLSVIRLGEHRRNLATVGKSTPDRARTCDPGIRNPQADPENTEENGGSGDDASRSPAVGREIDPDLQAVVEAWPDLPAALRDGIVAMVRTARGS